MQGNECRQCIVYRFGSLCMEDQSLKESEPLEDGTGRTCKEVASIDLVRQQAGLTKSAKIGVETSC